MVLRTPGKCSMVREKSKCATKNHSERSRRITNGSLEEPFLTAATTAMLSHWNSVTLRIICGPQTAQDSTMGTSSFAMIGMGDHSGGHCHWNQLPLKYPAQPHPPDESVWMVRLGGWWGVCHLKEAHPVPIS